MHSTTTSKQGNISVVIFMKAEFWCFDQFLVQDKIITNAKFHFMISSFGFKASFT